MTQEYISQVSEEIEGRVTEETSKKITWTESRILGALPKLDELLLNSEPTGSDLFRSRSGNIQE